MSSLISALENYTNYNIGKETHLDKLNLPPTAEYRIENPVDVTQQSVVKYTNKLFPLDVMSAGRTLPHNLCFSGAAALLPS